MYEDLGAEKSSLGRFWGREIEYSGLKNYGS